MEITYQRHALPDTDQIIDLYKSSGIIRPVHDKKRIAKMFEHSNLVMTAWHETLLVGIARSLSDFCYACYLSDLAVRKEYQQMGIGKMLIKKTKELAGEESNLILLSAPEALGYYPNIGFQKAENAFIIKRLQ
jgi:GNAT superfamily N-acetyltransferase